MVQHSKPIYTIYESGDVCTFKYKVKIMPPGFSDTVHSYDDLKLVHVTGGSGIWTIGCRDFHVSRDDVIIFSTADERAVKCVTSDEPFKVEQVEFLPITIYPWQSCADFFFERPAGFSNVLARGNEHHDRIIAGFDAIRGEIEKNDLYKDEFIVHTLTGMVISAARLCPTPKQTGSADSNNPYNIVCRAIAYINDNISGDLSRPTLAAMFFVSPSHFSRIFREYSGFCLQDYIVRCRVTHAVNLLRTSDIGVLEAALESGFSSSSGFYRAFRAVTGKKPTEIREDK